MLIRDKITPKLARYV